MAGESAPTLLPPNEAEGGESPPFDYLAVIGMPQEFVEATSGEFLGTVEAPTDSAPPSTALDRPFGEGHFIALDNNDDNSVDTAPRSAKTTRTPAPFIRNTINAQGKPDVEYGNPDWD